MNADLAEELEIACMTEMRGDPPGPGLARRLERACTTVLRRRGLTGARVVARSDRNGTFVDLMLPAPDRKVERVVVQLQAGTGRRR
jgi:hypothetical protein